MRQMTLRIPPTTEPGDLPSVNDGRLVDYDHRL
jgi:hypothetical protein